MDHVDSHEPDFGNIVDLHDDEEIDGDEETAFTNLFEVNNEEELQGRVFATPR